MSITKALQNLIDSAMDVLDATDEDTRPIIELAASVAEAETAIREVETSDCR